jgi:hypothetical protein
LAASERNTAVGGGGGVVVVVQAGTTRGGLMAAHPENATLAPVVVAVLKLPLLARAVPPLPFAFAVLLFPSLAMAWALLPFAVALLLLPLTAELSEPSPNVTALFVVAGACCGSAPRTSQACTVSSAQAVPRKLGVSLPDSPRGA